MGALTFTYTRVEQLSITQATYSTTSGVVTFLLQNSGTSDVSINQVLGTGGSLSNTAGAVTTATSGTPCTVTSGAGLIPKGTACTLAATFTGTTFASGTQYSFTLISTQGNKFPYAQVA